MIDHPAREHSFQQLGFGGVCRLRVQIGYQLKTDGSAYQRCLLDLRVHDEDEEAFEGARVLATLKPILYAGADAPRPYSLHQHRWHTSWGMSRNEPEIDLLVITGTASSDALMAADDAGTRAFRNLMELTGQPQ
jgi:hypothetical protein